MRVETTRATLRERVGSALLAGYPLVLAAPSFRALFFVLLLAGTAQGMVMAYVAVWASETFGLGPQGVAMLFVVSGVAGAIGNPALGLASDRLGKRRLLIAAQLVVTATTYVGYTQASSYPMALGLVAFSGFGVMGLTLAIVHDLIRALPESDRRNAARILATERTGWSIGIILGPAAAAAIVTAAGDTRPAFIAAALTQLVAVAVVSRVPEIAVGRGAPSTAPVKKGEASGSERNGRVEDGAPWTVGRQLALAVLVGGLILLTLPAQTRTMYLPLFVTQVLGEARGTVGPLFTLNAMTAVAMMPHVGSLADRFGTQRILYLGALVGVCYCTLQSVAGSYSQTLLIQVLIGLGIAFWSTSSLLYLQQLLPERAGVAGGLYLTAQQLTPVVSGLLLGPIAEVHGIPAAFSTTAVLALLAGVLLACAHRSLSKM